MKRHLLTLLLVASCLSPRVAAADHDDWEDWYDGDVHVELRLRGGAGYVVHPGEIADLSFRTDADAYVAVYAIDADGFVRLLFPRFWDDDGWIEGGQRVRLHDVALAYPLAAFGRGIVYVQAIASPVPFDWRGSGLAVRGGVCDWTWGGVAFRIQGDPYGGFNEVNRCLFPAWNTAVFVVDHTYFYVGRTYDHPTYLCQVCRGGHRGYHDPWFRLSVDIVWDLERGRRYCRPIYRPVYVYREGRRHLRHTGPEFGHEPRRRPGSRDVESRRDPERRHVKEVRRRERETPRQRGDDAERRHRISGRRSQVSIGGPAAPGDRSPSPAAVPPRIRQREAGGEREARWQRVGAARRGATPPAYDSNPRDGGPASHGAGSVVSRGAERRSVRQAPQAREADAPSRGAATAEASKRKRTRQ